MPGLGSLPSPIPALFLTPLGKSGTFPSSPRAGVSTSACVRARALAHTHTHTHTHCISKTVPVPPPLHYWGRRHSYLGVTVLPGGTIGPTWTQSPEAHVTEPGAGKAKVTLGVNPGLSALPAASCTWNTHNLFLGSSLLGLWPAPSTARAGKMLSWQPELALSSLFNAHPHALWVPSSSPPPIQGLPR
jgi:hypothetical protein